ncbi:MAG: hypothetical protein QM804_15660 [Propionicimonas sp.]
MRLLDPVAFNPITVITTAIGDLGETLAGVAGPAVGLAVGVFGLYFGWGLLRRFVN